MQPSFYIRVKRCGGRCKQHLHLVVDGNQIGEKSRQVVNVFDQVVSNCGLALFAEHQSAKVSESP